MRLTVADAISPSYFVAIAAIQLGFFREEGVDTGRDPVCRSLAGVRSST